MKGKNMSLRIKTALKRLARVLGAAAVASLIAWIAGPEFIGLVGTQYAVILVPILTGVLSSLDKYLRFTDAPVA
jgi:hypothetical protein